MIQNKKAFTLVELIVVITILTILGTIGMISFQGYLTYSRDIVRLSDLNNIRSLLEYNISETGSYPIPDNAVSIKYEGTVVWNQGSFGKETKNATKRLDKIPTDPLTGDEYTYSVSGDGIEFELAGAYEGTDFTEVVSLDQTYAVNEQMGTRIIGNYNGKVKTLKHNNIDYVLALPSLVAIDLSNTSDDNLEYIIENKLLTFNGYNSLPHSYKNAVPPDEGAFEFVPKKLVVWSGSITEMKKTGAGLTDLSIGLYSAYLGTNLYLKGDEFKYINGADVIKYILKAAPSEGNIFKNCKEIQKIKKATQSGCYSTQGDFIAADKSCIEDTTTERYYCDMARDGGGWTMYVKINANYDFSDAVDCVVGKNIINNSNLYCRVPFAFGKASELLYTDMTTNISYVTALESPFEEFQNIRSSFYKSSYFDLMYYAGTDNSFDADVDLSKVRRTRFGINFQHIDPQTGAGRNPGGAYYNGNLFMNYDSNDISGPSDGQGRKPLARAGEFYTR